MFAHVRQPICLFPAADIYTVKTAKKKKSIVMKTLIPCKQYMTEGNSWLTSLLQRIMHSEPLNTKKPYPGID